MTWLHRHMNFKGRIMLFGAAFFAALLVQLYVSYYQSTYVLDQMDQQTGNFHSISQFSGGISRQMSALSNYRWENGDSLALLETLRSNNSTCDAWLWRIDSDLSEVGEEQYLLARAVRITYHNYNLILEQLMEQLRQNDRSAASDIYYNELSVCGKYLQQYTSDLLQTAITEGQGTYSSLSELNAVLKKIQLVNTFICILLGILVIISVWQLLDPVQQMIVASKEIGKGHLDTPDVAVPHHNEIGQLARAFNTMKHSMVRQLQTLQEKNDIERELHRSETQALELQNTVERSRLQHLRSQIDPHFLFNTLGVILRVSDEEGAPRTRSLITALSQLLRYSLASNDLQVPLSREIRIIDEFYEIYHVRFGERVCMEWDYDEELDLTQTLVPSFILQPLVENAFKHGIIPKEKGGTVRIILRRCPVGPFLYIAVRDDGVGIPGNLLLQIRSGLNAPNAVSAAGEHIGVRNVADRLRLLEPPGTLRIYSRQGRGTWSVLFLPLIELEEPEF